jgi:[protein-PII] uridylyltransferase
MLSDAARTVSYYVDAGFAPRATRCRAAGSPHCARPVRRPLDEGVIEFDGEVILARDARPSAIPGLILRVAAASATTGLPMAASTLAGWPRPPPNCAHRGRGRRSRTCW